MKDMVKLLTSLMFFCVLFGCHNYEADKLDVSKQNEDLLIPPCVEK